MRCTPVVATLFAAAALAQGPFRVGERDAAWPNASGQGTPWLNTRVFYPATKGGWNGDMLPNPSGWPVVVFLHGFGLLGRDYPEIGQAWASHGFVVLMQDSAMWSYLVQVDDAKALLPAIHAANRDTGTFFAGAFDTQRIGIAGHSMGGASLGMVLADNPGYRCGLALAPVYPGPAPAAQVAVPFGLVVGTGDMITPWFSLSLPYYLTVAPATGLKFACLLDGACDHMSVAGLAGAEHPSFLRAADIGLGFFRHFLDLDTSGLDHCIGPVALADPQVVALAHEVAQPRIWAASRLGLGRTVRISVAAEQGIAGILAAPSTGWAVPTPIGTLLLDPSTTFTWVSAVADRNRRIDAWLTVPNNPALSGLTIAMQAVGASTGATLLLGSAAEFPLIR